ncbi:hypothetical protein QFC21_004304 [Naganishia friedmannii]|uniref:Uncharacterized protein n=1 Tax=Naganishia friedmannii TaxID=89922 RepID=A0ACC2VIL6_9TREE|nr:hypothetical protein QFC21_004304 [Naganishia friedmannii]
MSVLSSMASAAKRAVSTTRPVSKVPLLITPAELAQLPRSEDSLGIIHFSQKKTTKVLDVSWHMPNSARNPTQDYLAGPRIPGALRWDLDKIANPKTDDAVRLSDGESDDWKASGLAKNELGLGHMLPGPKRFASACSKLGITPSDHVVVYDSLGIFSAPRGAFTFTAMNHANVSVLDGGLPRYQAEGFELDIGVLSSEEEGLKRAGIDHEVYALTSALLTFGALLMMYSILPRHSAVPVSRTVFQQISPYDQVLKNSENASADDGDLIMDARSRERWSGEAPEPRAGLSSGHMPHAFSLPFTALLSPASGPSKPYTSFLPVEPLRQVIIRALSSPRAKLDLSVHDGGLSEKELAAGRQRWEQVKQGKKLTWSCGSGMTAAVGVWAMRLVAQADVGSKEVKSLDNVALYDESWTGYAMRDTSVIVKE